MDKIFKVSPAFKESGHQVYKLPANMSECSDYLNGINSGLTGREIDISHACPEYLNEEYEYKFMASEFGIVLEDVSNSIEQQLALATQKMHNDIKPVITNTLTPEDVDRYLFDHPAEPGLIAMLEKHGYIKHHELKDLAKQIRG